MFYVSPMKAGTTSSLGPAVSLGRPMIGKREAILINGRRLSPAGKLVRTQSYNWGLAVSPDEGKVLLMGSYSFEVVSLAEGQPAVERFPPYGGKKPGWMGCCETQGCAFSPDGKRLCFGDTYSGKVIIMDLASRSLAGEVDLNVAPFTDSYPGDFVLSA